MEDVIILLIPIIAVTGAFALAMYGYHYRTRVREMLHEERKIALEKNIPLPPDFVERRNPETAHKNAALINRKVFVILFFIGIAFAIFFPDKEDPTGNFVGGLLVLSSFAFYVISTFKYRMSPEEKHFYSAARDYGEPLTPSEKPKE